MLRHALFCARNQPRPRPPNSEPASSLIRSPTLACGRSFVATFAFGLGVVLPLKGRAECLNFVTAFLVSTEPHGPTCAERDGDGGHFVLGPKAHATCLIESTGLVQRLAPRPASALLPYPALHSPLGPQPRLVFPRHEWVLVQLPVHFTCGPSVPAQVEKSLSVDNLFVFLMIFEYFKVPEQHTQRVLK